MSNTVYLTFFIHSYLTSLLPESANFIHLKEPRFLPPTPRLQTRTSPNYLCLIAQAVEGGWFSAGLIKMLMRLKGNISLARQKEAVEKKKSALLNIRPFHFVEATLYVSAGFPDV